MYEAPNATKEEYVTVEIGDAVTALSTTDGTAEASSLATRATLFPSSGTAAACAVLNVMSTVASANDSVGELDGRMTGRACIRYETEDQVAAQRYPDLAKKTHDRRAVLGKEPELRPGAGRVP